MAMTNLLNGSILPPVLVVVTMATAAGQNTNPPAPPVPRFSIAYMDRSINPAKDFYRFSDGTWIRQNPVPADKSRWSSFNELAERNWFLLQGILEQVSKDKSAGQNSPRGQVGAFFASAMDTNRIERLRFLPISEDLKRIDRIESISDLFALLADFHTRGIGGF